MIKRLLLLISIIALIAGYYLRETTVGGLLILGTIVVWGTIFAYTMIGGCWPGRGE